jgi:hypothetical protein
MLAVDHDILQDEQELKIYLIIFICTRRDFISVDSDWIIDVDDVIQVLTGNSNRQDLVKRL